MTILESRHRPPNDVNVTRLLFVCLTLIVTSALAQPAPPDAPDTLLGRVEGKSYVSPTGAFRVQIPVLPELGGRIVDTENVVTFQDDFNVLCTIAAFPMDATLRWELSTRGRKDYLAYFFANYVLPDFQHSFRGAQAESAKYATTMAQSIQLSVIFLVGE